MSGVTVDAIFAAMAAASVGELGARVAIPADPSTDDPLTRLGIALNMLLDDLKHRTDESEAAHRVNREELERMVQARTEELSHLNHELEAFSYSVAHDLRRPLRVIDGYAQIMTEDCPELGTEALRCLARVQAGTAEMAHLIDDLLELSRVGRADLVRQRVDVSAIARRVLKGLRQASPERDVEVTIPGGLTAEADARLLGVVFENLIGNAWKYTSKLPRAHIEVGLGHAGYYVKDDGAGFDPTYAHKLFGVFQRLHTGNQFEGTGIGLAIVQRIVLRHGGRVWAEGAVDRGATFGFTLG